MKQQAERVPGPGVVTRDGIVQRIRGLQDWPVIGVGSKGAEGKGINKKVRDVLETANPGIVDENMRVVQLERVSKAVVIGRQRGN